MQRLLVVRHEEAHPARSGDDAIRTLTSRGRQRMHKLARSLVEHLTTLDHIWTSPLVRAVQTAEILQSAFDIHTPVSADPMILQPSTAVDLRKLVETSGTAAIIGHEPTVSTFTSHLTHKHSVSPAFQTGQAVLLRLDGTSYTVEGVFRGSDTIAI
ncbi:MAG: histidine phosphatase family protein [Myxococcales bacterium]|nr:histidine phosphatase family protein [Myxococcales bacterium]